MKPGADVLLNEAWLASVRRLCPVRPGNAGAEALLINKAGGGV